MGQGPAPGSTHHSGEAGGTWLPRAAGGALWGRERGVSSGRGMAMSPLPVLEGGPAVLPATGIVPVHRGGQVQLTMSPGGPCRPWGPMGPGSPWERQHDEGQHGAHPARGSRAHPLPHSPPLPAGPCSLGGQVCHSHPKRRDTMGSTVCGDPGPGATSSGLSPLSVPQCHRRSPLVLGDPGAPSSP